MRNLILLGANNPEVIRQAQALERSGLARVTGFLDNDPLKQGGEFGPYSILGGVSEVPGLLADGTEFVNVITRDARTRHNTTQELLVNGASLGQFIHPSVTMEGVTYGDGCYIQEFAILQARVLLGRNASVSTGAIINHECCLGESVFVAPGANLCGLVEVGKGVFIGASAVVLPRLKIGDWAVIGAGAVVTRDVPRGAVVVGNPARIVRYISVEEGA